MSTFVRAIVTTLCVFLCLGFKSNLPFPEREASIETLTRGIHAVVQLGAALYLLPEPPAYLIKVPFNPKEGSRERRFGSFIDAQRLNWPRELTEAKPGMIAGFGDDNLLLFDDQELSIAQITTASVFLVKRALVWDTIRPAADGKGEPPAVEVQKLRGAFKSAFQRSKTRITGIAQIPEAWMGQRDKLAFAASTEIPGFPLVILSCLKENPTQCSIDRNCFVEGHFSKTPRGVAVLPKQRSLLVGDATMHRIVAYKFHSCFHVTRTDEMVLPAKIKDVANISIDQDERLWLTSSAPDDYTNASVYMWDKTQWQDFL